MLPRGSVAIELGKGLSGVVARLVSYCCDGRSSIRWGLESVRFDPSNMLQNHTLQSVGRGEKSAKARIQNGCMTEIVLVVEVLVGAHRPIAT